VVTRRRRAIRGVLALALLLLPVAAAGHAMLVRATPPPRATLRLAPARAQLWFSERLEPAYSTVAVWREGARVDHPEAVVAAEDGRSLTVPLPPLERGVYQVMYRVLSVDGHVVEGSYSFSVAGRTPAR
jgi:methionine-rich copper-binding protein CopC